MIGPLPSEDEVLKRCASGDTGAFDQIVTHYQDVIFNLVYRMLGHRETAQDVTQEVFIKAFRNLRSFAGRSSFATWLYSIAVNQAISERRRQRSAARGNVKQWSALGDGESRACDPPGQTPSPDARLHSAETRRQIEQAIAELDDGYRAVVVLRDVEGLDYRSIGEALGCSHGTVKSRLHRARLELRRKLRGLLTRDE